VGWEHGETLGFFGGKSEKSMGFLGKMTKKSGDTGNDQEEMEI
jgi:hypothetical protein